MVLAGVISHLLSLGSKLLPVVHGSSSLQSSDDHNQKVEAELEALMKMLARIRAALYDAEQREIRDVSVQLWLRELKRVAYDAEDVLDEYHYEVLRAQVEARQGEGSPTESRKRKIVQVPDGMFDQIQQIRNNFTEIENHRIALRLLEEDGPRRCNSELQIAPTSHLVDESGIFGLEGEKEKLIDLMLTSRDAKVVSVVAVVGCGGLGKTTIAQLAYNDQTVRQNFDKFCWICVSDNFDVERLTKELVVSFGGSTDGIINLSFLQEKICEMIRGKRVLLVLDDVWNEKRSLWNTFQAPFKSASFAKILVTTRNELVAQIMQTMPSFNLSYLPEEQCRQLFEHYAFGGVNQREGSFQVKIGKQILKKCGMLPLAIKSIASLLRHEAEEESWRDLLESELWECDVKNEIFPPLQISYARLPTYLKPCLVFCSMFPKDHVFHIEELVNLWISQGYIESNKKKNVEKVELEYGKQLWQRSFLEGVHGNGFRQFKLHDMIHDLARLNSKNGCSSIEVGASSSLPVFSDELCHLCVPGKERFFRPISFDKSTILRTLIIEDLAVANFFCTFDFRMAERLRALVINECQYYELESVFAGSLKHVRYLSLGYSFVERLPECFCALYNLRNLKLIKCFFSKLPTNIGNLVSLEKLLIEGCIFLQQLPESICQLTTLRELVVSDCRKLEELPSGIGSLTNLQTLETMKCPFRKLPTSTRNLVSLENLVIEGYDFLERFPDSLLCQLKALRKLIVSGCSKLEELPSSIGSLTNLQTLELEKCAFNELPTSIRNLVNLENLVIKRCCSLERLPDSLCQLEALRKLVVYQCSNLGELPCNIGNLTNLQTLKIDRCKSSLPPSLAKIVGIQSLMVDLECDKIGQLKHFVNLGGTLCLENLQNLSNLTDLQCGSLVSMHKLQSLLLRWGYSLYDHYGTWYNTENEIGGNVLRLFIDRGQNIPPEDQNHFAVMARLQPHSNLKRLVICEYGGSRFPEWFRNPSSCASLERLELFNCNNVRFLPFGSPGKLKYLLLARCDSLLIIRADSLPPELQELTIECCENLTSVPGIQRLNSLVKLCIENCNNMHLLMMDPEPSVELTRLTNESSYLLGLRNLTSLKSLQIRWCPKLQLLADELPCVESCEVEVDGCPLLKEWCLQNGIDYDGNFLLSFRLIIMEIISCFLLYAKI